MILGLNLYLYAYADPNRWADVQGYDNVEITVVDDSDWVGWAAAATRAGEVYMRDVRNMVEEVLKKAGTDTISRLNVLDHGTETGFELGRDWIDTSTLPYFKKELGRLREHLASGGFVHLQHCGIGQNVDLLIDLSKILGVPIYAGTDDQNPVYRFNWGTYVRAMPDGTFYVDVGRP